jgi:hypothetical protein
MILGNVLKDANIEPPIHAAYLGERRGEKRERRGEGGDGHRCVRALRMCV